MLELTPAAHHQPLIPSVTKAISRKDAKAPRKAK
jgi:hypothetical protein